MRKGAVRYGVGEEWKAHLQVISNAAREIAYEPRHAWHKWECGVGMSAVRAEAEAASRAVAVAALAASARVGVPQVTRRSKRARGRAQRFNSHRDR